MDIVKLPQSKYGKARQKSLKEDKLPVEELAKYQNIFKLNGLFKYPQSLGYYTVGK